MGVLLQGGDKSTKHKTQNSEQEFIKCQETTQRFIVCILMPDASPSIIHVSPGKVRSIYAKEAGSLLGMNICLDFYQ